SAAFLIARNAASTAESGLPTNVTTVRFVLAPGSTSNSETPSTDAIASVICRMMFWSRPSEKFGTHSINFCIAQGSADSAYCNGGTRPSQIFRAWNAHVRNHRAIVARLASSRRPELLLTAARRSEERRGHRDALAGRNVIDLAI